MLFHAIFYWILDKINAWLIEPPKMTTEEIEEAKRNLRLNGHSEEEIEKLLENFRETS